MNLLPYAALYVLAAYLVGSIPFGVLIGKLKGVDPRTVGSGNIGMTNVWRALGPGPALLVFALDIAKGYGPVWLIQNAARLSGHDGVPMLGYPWWDATLAVVVGIAAIIGHNWPIFLRFKGGKGVSTSFGVMLALDPRVALTGIALFGVALAVTRYVSVGSCVAAISQPLLFLYTQRDSERKWPLAAFGVLVAVFVLIRHRANFQRIKDGTEPKVGSSKNREA